jgi:cytochrome c-type biogenesis protein CcmH/NrfG
MTNQQLQAQFQKCQEWNDPDQWDMLALEYHRNGYTLNAVQCFRKADELRGVAFAEAVPETMLLAEAHP